MSFADRLEASRDAYEMGWSSAGLNAKRDAKLFDQAKAWFRRASRSQRASALLGYEHRKLDQAERRRERR